VIFQQGMGLTTRRVRFNQQNNYNQPNQPENLKRVVIQYRCLIDCLQKMVGLQPILMAVFMGEMMGEMKL